MSGLEDDNHRQEITVSTHIYKRRTGPRKQAWASKGLTYNESNRTIVVNSTVAEENRGENNRAQHKIDLKRDDITVFNNSKVIVGAPTEFALEIKFQSYRKRNWHICFMNVEDQMQWQKILLGCNNNEGDEAENSKGSGSLTDDSSDLVWSEAGSSSKSIDLEIVENWSDDEESDATYIPRFAMSIISFASSILSAFYRLFGFKSEKVEETIVDIVSVTQVETPIENSIQPSPKSKEKLRPGLSFPRVTLRSESSLNETIQIAGIDSATSARVLATAGVNETNQEETHCFMNTPSSCFELRVGPDYKNNKKKAPSAPALYDCHMMDFCANDNFISSVKDVFELPVVKGVTDQDTGCSHVPPIIIFNAQMPSRSTFHYSVIAYGIITEDTRRQLKDINSASPAVKLLVEYCKKAESEKKMSGRTKLIGRIEGIETTRLPPFITRFNGKPALLNSGELSVKARLDHLEVTVDFHQFSFVGKKLLAYLHPKMKSLKVDIALTIEGREDSELPEVLLFASRAMKMDCDRAQILHN